MASGPAPRVGDVVLAIGNALGLSHTVTMGIISATRRQDAGSPLFEGFLQTDAAINAGNSGGALVNVKGELIGINTRNLGSIQGAQGIGFAIPMEIAQGVMDQIIEYGSVQRGWLGAVLTDFPPATLSEEEEGRRGVYVYSVSKGGPAWIAGIREGDAISSLNGVAFNDTQSFNLSISSSKPGMQVELEVRRGKETFQTYATLIQQPPMP
jgi:S1-C subfamily serine protease